MGTKWQAPQPKRGNGREWRAKRRAPNGVERGELDHDALARFPQLLVAPALLAILWSSLFERFAPLDVRELMRAHVELLLGTRDAP